ncbi:hypothetical protein BCR34DRAFT_313803 [Clohesyomyces aquaticus]|uniref:Uncharacterized protein n=1 Tax=Clohesyomyces aquaticus TaxID=1231657 RepID=A0A1Y1ZPL0_9PLEO|nr:hypothetical protein BCR34DRAFT_313803 [Clohesyomyces aquaticus]
MLEDPGPSSSPRCWSLLSNHGGIIIISHVVLFDPPCATSLRCSTAPPAPAKAHAHFLHLQPPDLLPDTSRLANWQCVSSDHLRRRNLCCCILSPTELDNWRVLQALSSDPFSASGPKSTTRAFLPPLLSSLYITLHMRPLLPTASTASGLPSFPLIFQAAGTQPHRPTLTMSRF